MSDKFKGHTPGPKEAEYFHGYFQVLKRNAGDLVAKFVSDADAELFIAAPELLAENERLRARVADLVGAITSLNHSKHHEVIIVEDAIGCDVGYYQRKEWVEWILELAAQT